MKPEQLMKLVVGLYALAVVAAVAMIASHKNGGEGSLGGNALAIVKISGVIRTRSGGGLLDAPDADALAKRLHKLSENDDVKAILLRIDTPGGTVGAVQEIETEIQRCRAKGKKIVASLGDVAASGGYYLASSADYIVSDPGTITGSIGVILEFGNLEGLMQKLGVRLQVVKSGAHKDIGSPARALTDEERAMLQSSIDDAYAQFLQAVATGRHRALEEIRPLADGRIFTGRQAKQLGLVDQLGNQEDAIQKAIELAHLPAHPRIVSGGKGSLGEMLQSLSGRATEQPLELLVRDFQAPALEYRWR